MGQFSHLLNADGTVNLDSAERALKLAKRDEDKAYAACRIAEREVYRIPSYRIEHGRALKRLDVARSNANGASDLVSRLHGAVDEALNPGD